ncbi:MAG: adenosylhomocysteinase [candidate division WOR-3 bacterium]
MNDYKIRDIGLAEGGVKRIEWASSRMPVLNLLVDEFKESKPLTGYTISACLHVTTETANLIIALKRLGAKVYLAPSNPLSTQDDVAAALVKYHDISVFALHGEDLESYYENLYIVANKMPQIIMDDGGDLTKVVYEKNIPTVIGGTEETTTGVLRLRAMAKDGLLRFPVIAVNDSQTKYLFDNRYGTGQSTIDGILRATNILISSSTFVIAGYGWCGRGIAMRARGMGARVIITEVDPIKALEAYEDGFLVMPMREAARLADVIVTATGCKKVVTEEHFSLLKDGAILANAGHFDVEIDVKYLRENAKSIDKIRDNLERIILKSGKTLYLLAEGRLVNLAAAEGHPAEVMDLSFSNQLLAVLYLIDNRGSLKPGVYVLPEELDRRVAFVKLKSLGIMIDELSEEQKAYLTSWKEGT